jgi:hypothetical protein
MTANALEELIAALSEAGILEAPAGGEAKQ